MAKFMWSIIENLWLSGSGAILSTWNLEPFCRRFLVHPLNIPSSLPTHHLTLSVNLWDKCKRREILRQRERINGSKKQLPFSAMSFPLVSPSLFFHREGREVTLWSSLFLSPHQAGQSGSLKSNMSALWDVLIPSFNKQWVAVTD